MTERVTPRARRMAPEARKEQLLDSAVAYILERGLSDFSLEKVAQQAGVSLPLVYKYFPKREDILKAVLEREYRYLGANKVATLADEPVAAMIHRSNRHGFAYLYERGPIIRILASDRAVAELVRDRGRAERTAVGEGFIDRLVQTYGVPREVAQVCTILTVNAPILSGRALKKVGIGAYEAAELWSEFAIGGWQALQRRYAAAGAAPPKADAAAPPPTPPAPATRKARDAAPARAATRPARKAATARR